MNKTWYTALHDPSAPSIESARGGVGRGREEACTHQDQMEITSTVWYTFGLSRGQSYMTIGNTANVRKAEICGAKCKGGKRNVASRTEGEK